MLHPKGTTAFPKPLRQKVHCPQKSVYADSIIPYLGKKWHMCVRACVRACVCLVWMDDAVSHYFGNAVNQPSEIIN